MDTDTEFLENIKACRTCGIHYVTPSKQQLKHLFESPLEHSEIMLIRLELAQWNIEVAENDGYPQFVCNTCIHKFEQVFELRAACINAQNEFRKFYNVPNGNLANVKIKTELPDETNEEQTICDFIYVDDLSDTEYDGATPFNIPHVPIKEEVIEAATIPAEVTQQSTNIVESATEVVSQTLPSSSQIAQLVLQNKSVSEPSPTAQQQVECKLCQHLSPDQEEHKQHMQRAHEIRDMDCHICGKQFKNSTPARLKFHMKWHTLNKHVKCTLCGFVCSSKDALREHKRANHGKINCKICGKGVLARKMKSHLRQHELLTKYSCEYCSKVFTTEDERENHIWQIHANEDDNHVTNSPTTIQTSYAHSAQETSHNIIYGEQQEGEQMCQEPEENIINYKFLCAHCDQGFVEQIDLETHVNEEHRVTTHMTATITETESHNEESILNNTVAMSAPEQDHDVDHTNITVFEDYDNDTDIHDTQNTNTSFVTQTEPMDHDEGTPQETDTETPEEYHTESALNNTTTDEEEQEENNDEHATNSAEETLANVPPAHIENSFNTFACAKCSETFATIEQLRQHYDQHLATEQQQSPKTTPTKSQFKCNLCGKSFDLKFSLNRHVKKHKNAPV
ncbi:zinc finger protein 33A [Lucilia sericata]|uniref:zinc finger protein 33A n=1 Tax=Lucilia sericata TaxID=13632 RepID=UPI0018A85CEC|nr:zinc finger protein 33A [Lucilia sericata]